MPQSPLAPLQSKTILVAAAVSLALWHWVSQDFALGTFLTALWAVVWFRSTEGLIRTAARPKGQPRSKDYLSRRSRLPGPLPLGFAMISPTGPSPPPSGP